MADFTISLRAARINAGYSKKEVADVLGVSLGSINNWENGRTEITANALSVLADLYKIPIGYFRLP